jgi:hypothetical protein
VAGTHPKTFSDLYSAVLSNVRADSAVTAMINEAKRMVNTALHDMHISHGEFFPWCHRRANMRTQPQYFDGTIAVTQGSTTVTGTGTLWNTDNPFGVKNVRAGGKLTIDGSTTVYEVASVASDTSLTLGTMFVGADIATGNYTYFEDEYALPDDFLRPVQFRFFDYNREITLIGEREFRMNFPRNKTPSQPRHATIIDAPFVANPARVRKVIFAPPPVDTYIIPFSYVTENLAVSSAGVEKTELVVDTDEPIIPLSLRHMLAYKAQQMWFLDRRDDVQRAASSEALYQGMLQKIIGDAEVGQDHPRIAVRTGPYGRSARNPYRHGRSGRYTLGTAFDEIR